MSKYKKVPNLKDLAKFAGKEWESIKKDADTLLNDPSYLNKLDALISLGIGISPKEIVNEIKKYQEQKQSKDQQNKEAKNEQNNKENNQKEKNPNKKDTKKQPEKDRKEDKNNFRDVKMLSDSYLKKHLGLDPHQFKFDIVGSAGSKFNIYQNNTTKELVLISHDKKVLIPTKIFIGGGR